MLPRIDPLRPVKKRVVHDHQRSYPPRAALVGQDELFDDAERSSLIRQLPKYRRVQYQKIAKERGREAAVAEMRAVLHK